MGDISIALVVWACHAHGIWPRQWGFGLQNGGNLMKRRHGFMTVAAAAATLALATLTGAPAMAATAQWHYGDACHNVIRSETGATLSQSRTGVRGSGGSSAGLSQLTVWFGANSTTAWTSSMDQNGDGTRGYKAGKLRVNWSGGQAGECSGKSVGTALNVGAPGSRIAEPVPESATVLESETVDGVDVNASENTTTGVVTVSAAGDDFDTSAVFTAEQVANGEAQMFILSTDESEGLLVTYDPAANAAIDVAPAEGLPTPQR